MRNFLPLLFVFLLVACTSQTKKLVVHEKASFIGSKVIFDTDSAFFNDDGAALVMLLQSEKFDILGITVTAGNYWIPQGSAYMLHLLEVMNRKNIPVFLGETSTIKNKRDEISKLKSIRLLPGEKRKTFLAWTGALEKPEDHKIEPPFGGEFSKLAPKEQNAVDFIIEKIRAYPDEITIVALGPMTNIAAAIKKAPDIQKKIKSLLFMGGTLEVNGNTTPFAEFNFWFDSNAADIVLQSAIDTKVMFGLDLTNQAVLTKAEFDKVVSAKTPVTEIYKQDLGYRFPRFYKNPKNTSFVWDALVSAYMVDRQIVSSHQQVFLKVDHNFDRYMGQVRLNADPKKDSTPVRVMKKLDRTRFFELYSSLLMSPIH